MKLFKNIVYILFTFVFVACDIKDDIPFPIVHGQITEFQVEGQCGADGSDNITTTIDKEKRTITLYVSDTVNLSKLRVTKIALSGITYNPDVNYTDVPTIYPDSASCLHYKRFPKHAFSSTEDADDTRVNFSHPVRFIVRTYQDYHWTVEVKQIVVREIEVENQVGKAVIDPHTCNAIVYVSQTQSLKKLKVLKFTLGGQHGNVSPDPTKEQYSDFYNVRQFVVRTGWGQKDMWNVAVYQTEQAIETTAKAFARNHSITISGDKANGAVPQIEYKEASSSVWHTVSSSSVTLTSTTYISTINGLKSATKYNYRVTAGESATAEQEISTVAIQELPNASFDDWCIDASNPKLFCPWAQGGTSFWDTGNRGATSVGNSNSVPTSETSTGSGKAAFLESKYIVIKFAAGNIFTGTYLKTDGTNGILGFGRPFVSFPKQLSFDYKYTSKTIDRVGDAAYDYLKGRADSCSVYIALWHVPEDELQEYQGEKYPLIIRTKPGVEQSLFSPNDPRVIAYGQFASGKTVTDWQSKTIDIEYYNKEKTPTHILIVASSSKYGDFFTGGVGSTLVIDNMKLIY
ncbi:MAG: PCMD domain-containing protein [Bacteroidaceae bacterium]|nr:PCMD domain-containing protein [Bacteroidaceae bacterium]